MPLGATSPTEVWKRAVMRTSPYGTSKDLQKSWATPANTGMSYFSICANQLYICSALPSHLLRFCCSQKRATLGHELLPYSRSIWAPKLPGIFCGKVKEQAVVTLPAKCCRRITGIHCYFHTTVTGETNLRHFENIAVFWRLKQYGLKAKAKSTFFPRKPSTLSMC